MEKFLNTLLKRYNAQFDELLKRSEEAESIDEVKAIGEQLKTIKAQIAEVEAQIEESKKGEENQNGKGEESQDGETRGADLKNAQVRSMFSYNNATKPVAKDEIEDETNSVEYRTAFMNHVLAGAPAPTLTRADEHSTTTDTGSIIPTVIIDKIVEKMDVCGMILPLVTKMNYPCGVKVPTSAIKPVATWVGEGEGSDKQKKVLGEVVFTHHKLRCEIAMTAEVDAMALSAFEKKFIENVAKAMVIAQEDAIINGAGTKGPKGILKETVPADQTIEITAGAITYDTLCDLEAAVPEEYDDSAKYFCNKKTFLAIQKIKDAEGQPIARVNIGLDGKPQRILLGREVVFASKYLPKLDPAKSEVVLFAFDMADYGLNTVYDMGIETRKNWDNEDRETKAVMAVDGKAFTVDSLVVLKNKTA